MEFSRIGTLVRRDTLWPTGNDVKKLDRQLAVVVGLSYPMVTIVWADPNGVVNVQDVVEKDIVWMS